MASFDFPSTPSNGQSYTANGITYTFDGTAWKRNTGAVKGQKGEEGTAATKGQKGEVGAGAKGQKGEQGADNSTKGQKGEPSQIPGTKGQKGEEGQKGQKGEGTADTLDTVCDRGNSTDQNITTTGTLNDAAGNVREIVNNTKTGAYTLTANDVGELINTNSNVTIPSGVFSAGQGVTIYNNSSSNITIARSGVTAYTVGTATNTDKTLAQKGLATVMCVSANTFVVLGGGLS